MITKSAVDRALRKRKKAAEKYKANPIILRGDFPQQNAFIEDTSRFLAAQCSRRAGKTSALAIRFLRTMEKYPKSTSLYLSLTQESARGIMWPVLQDMNDTHKLGCKFVESKMEMTAPNGAKLKLMGADIPDFVKRLKGRKYPAVAIDEAQDFGAHLNSLINDVLTPSIADYTDGWLALAGTPGPVPTGMFFDITESGKFGFSLHKWDLTMNPYMPNAIQFITELKKRQEWDDQNPTLLREYKNQWVLDMDSLWIRYTEKINHYQELPPGKYKYILGVDIGYKDADALAVVGWSETDLTTYLIEETLVSKQGITELAEQIADVRKRYDIAKIVMDEGGLGKKAAEEIRRRHALPIQPADKTRKQENVALLNDHLRTGRFKAKSGSRFAQDSYKIQIDWDRTTPDKIVIKRTFHSDIIDSVLYAFKESPAWTYRAPEQKFAWGTKEWADAQVDTMFKQALEHYTEEAAKDNRVRNGGWDD